MIQGILRVYPDLAGRLAEQNALSPESYFEQKSSGLLALALTEKNYLRKYNRAYKLKFGFPFVICARENKKEAILREISARYERLVEEETEKAIQEVLKIALFRLKDKVSMNEDQIEDILSRFN